MSAFTTVPSVGAIGLVRMKGIAGRLVRGGQWLLGDGFQDLEHAMVCVDVSPPFPPTGEVTAKVVEARPGGASTKYYEPGDGVLWWTPPGITGEQRQRIAIAARRYLGTPYSFADYVALATHRLHLWVPGLKTYIANSGHMICSQLADQAYADAGIHLFQDRRWPGFVTPGDLYRRCHRQLWLEAS